MGAIELIKSDLFRYAGTTSSKAFIKTYVNVSFNPNAIILFLISLCVLS